MGLGTQIKLIRLYFKVKPTLDLLEKEFKMKVSTNMILQIIATLGQLVNQLGGVLPEKYKSLITAVLAGTQGVVAVMAHYSNPDGTDSKVSYAPKV